MHTIKFVAQQTGLSQHTIRAWERRYGALLPDRTATNRRLYTAEDVEKLSLLQQAVRAGHSIGRIAALSVTELNDLLMESRPVKARSFEAEPGEIMHGHARAFYSGCLRAVETLDAEALEYCLTRGGAMLGAVAMVENVVLPLLKSIGDNWREGDLRPAHEHMATAILRTYLGGLLASFQPPADAPRLIVTTPVGQVHELGALVAAVTAASEGWAVLYLGPNLTAAEIAGAARRYGAAAVALSIVYPPDDPEVSREFTELRDQIGQETTLLVGGSAAPTYQRTIAAIGAKEIADMPGLRRELAAVIIR